LVGWAIGLGILFAMALVIGLSEMHKAYNPSTGKLSKAWVLQSIGAIGVALFAVWRGRKDMRKH